MNRGRTSKLRPAILRIACALGALVPICAIGASQAQAATFTPLTLQNGWTNAPFGTRDAALANINGLVQLEGAIATTGTNPVPFTLPTADRPLHAVYVPISLCDSTNGRLFIQPSGVVTVQAQGGAFSNAQCFTSLEGVSYPVNTSGYTNLTLQNGWTNDPFSTRNAAAEIVSSIVHLKGAIATKGTNPVPFTLPTTFRPVHPVYVPVATCNATIGRLEIDPSGTVTVQAPSFSNAACFTSLEGVSYPVNTSGYTNLTLQNGWTNSPFGTRNAAAEIVGGVVRLKGAIATPGTNPVAFTLPTVFRPSTDVYVPVDMCNATSGRLEIDPSGTVTVQASSFSNAACFTSLEGVTFPR